MCTQDQLGAAWFLGYENGCRGWGRDEFGKGIEQFAQEAFHEVADRPNPNPNANAIPDSDPNPNSRKRTGSVSGSPPCRSVSPLPRSAGG